MLSAMQKQALSELGRRTGPPPISWLMATAIARPNLISLAAGFTDNETLPVAEMRELMQEVLGSRQSGQAALQYGTTAGDRDLCQLTAQRLAELDETGSTAWYAPERIIISNGSQQMLYMVTEALCDPGDIVLVEDPTYFVYLGIVQSHGLQARGVRLEQDGLDLGHLEKVLEGLKRSGQLHRLKLLYLVSYYQNPTGATTAFRKKAAALDLLRRYERFAGHRLYLLEDAAYRELRFRGEETASALAASGHGKRVILLGTYSKPFATGARIGFGLLPEPLYTTVLRIKGNHDFGSANLLQHVLARAIRSGRYARHLARLQRRYAHKAEVMQAGMKEHFPPAVQWQMPEGGLYYWVRLPRGLKSGMKSMLFRDALAANVLYVPGDLCYAEDPTRPRPGIEMRLSFGSVSDEDIRTGIARLGKALQRASR
jgi:2-aminoadipate transaminase